VGRDLARHLAHGFEERQAAVYGFHRLVGDADNLPSENGFGQFQIGGQVQILDLFENPDDHSCPMVEKSNGQIVTDTAPFLIDHSTN
jgi:hypothetical protein